MDGKKHEEREKGQRGKEQKGHSPHEKHDSRKELAELKESGRHGGKENEGKELTGLKESLQRLQAEFENSRKRMDKEKQDFAMVANAGLVKELLPLVDSVDAAERHLNGQKKVGKEQALEGIESIKKQLLAVLKSNGLEEMACLGKKFDPMKHDCVMQGREKGKEDGLVLEELQKGYLLNGRVLRHAKVKVNKNE